MLKKFVMLLAGTLFLILVLLTGPLWVYLSGQLDLKTHWSMAKRESTKTAPNPKEFKPALVRVYYARSFNWRGAFGAHTWMALKDEGAPDYQILQVMGWRLFGNQSTVDQHNGNPDRYWYGEKPMLVGEITGSQAGQAITRIREAATNYPYSGKYRIWPGPNSNTFVAYLMRSAGILSFALPPTAIGKDYPVKGEFLSRPPSGTGWQLSFLGLLGACLSTVEGLRFHLLGLEFGWNPLKSEFYWPGVGILSYR